MSGENETGAGAVTEIQPTEPGWWWMRSLVGPPVIRSVEREPCPPPDGSGSATSELRFWSKTMNQWCYVSDVEGWLEPVTSIQDVAALRLGLAHAQEDVRALRQQAEEREVMLRDARTDTSRARMEIDAARRVVYQYVPEQDDETPAEAVTRFIEGVREGRIVIDRVESERATAERNVDLERLKTAQQAARLEAERANDRAMGYEKLLSCIDLMLAGAGYGPDDGLVEHRLRLLLQEFRSTREALLRELSA